MGKLMLRIRADKFKAFRESSVGKQLERFVDIFAQGNGWYEITSKDMVKWTALFGTTTDGLKVWLSGFNKHMLGSINANPVRTNLQYVKRVVPTQAPQVDPQRLKALQQRFAHN
jgi:hypothetical protein